jgi:outer membrane murein-binding lipoprotein Lpp
LWEIVQLVRIITLGGAVISLITAYQHPSDTAQNIIAAASIAIAVVSLADLVLSFSASAEKHEALYRRFKQLQADVERLGSDVSEKQIAESTAAAQAIRVDEPPTLWAVYAKCWNEVIEHHSAERAGYYRHVAWWRSLVGWLISFNPQDFPPTQSAS